MNWSYKMVSVLLKPESKRRLFHCFLIFALTLLIYFPAFSHDFVNFDDPTYTFKEPMVTRGLSWEGVYWSLSDYHFFNYHPLTWWSYMLDVELFGVSASAFHGVNLVLHFFCGVAFYFLLIALGATSYQSLIGAAIFVGHPTQVESVAWIAERKNLLSNLFGFLSLLCYLRFGRIRGWRAYWGSIILFVLALLSKPMVVTLPCLLLLLDFWPLKRVSVDSVREFFHSVKGVLLEKIPFFMLTVIFCKLTVGAQKAAMHGEASSLLEKLVKSTANVGHYMKLYVFPSNLNVLHLSNEVNSTLTIALCTLPILFGITFWSLRTLKSHGANLVGWLWFLGTLVPVIGLIQVGAQSYAERYMYWSCPGLILMTVFWLPKERPKSGLAKLFIPVVIVILSGLSFYRNLDWKTSETLFRSSVSLNPKNGTSLLNLSQYYAENNRIRQALQISLRNLEIAPDDLRVQLNCVKELFLLGEIGRAEELIDQIMRDGKANDEVLAIKGNLCYARREYHKARERYFESLKLNPVNGTVHFNLSMTYKGLGETEKSERFQRVSQMLLSAESSD